MKYGIKFTADELETLNTSLNAASVYFDNKSRMGELAQGIRDANIHFRDEANSLWLRIYEAQRVAGLRNPADPVPA